MCVFGDERSDVASPVPEPECASPRTRGRPRPWDGPADLRPGPTPPRRHSRRSRVVTTRCAGRVTRSGAARAGPGSTPTPRLETRRCTPGRERLPPALSSGKAASGQEGPRPPRRRHSRGQQALKLEVYLANEFSPRCGGACGPLTAAGLKLPRLCPSLEVKGPGSGRPRPQRRGAWLGEGALSWPHRHPPVMAASATETGSLRLTTPCGSHAQSRQHGCEGSDLSSVAQALSTQGAPVSRVAQRR